MIWNKKNIHLLDYAPTGHINEQSLNFENQSITVWYTGPDALINKEDNDESPISDFVSSKEYKCVSIFEDKKKVDRLLVYLKLVKRITCRSIPNEENNINEVYFSISLECYIDDSFVLFDDLYEKFLKHISIDSENLPILKLDYFIRLDEETEKRNIEMREENKIIDNMDYFDSFSNSQESHFNDNLDLNQQSMDFWDNA